jgi:hypothetical protein
MGPRLIGRIVLLCLAVATLAPAQQFVYSYVLPTNLNTVPLHPGDTLTFPPTPPSGVAQALLNITNNSSLPGQIANITTSGSAFGVAGLPLFPATVSGGQTLQVLVRYQPSGATQDGGNITVAFTAGGQVSFNLLGSLSSSKFVYTLVQGTQTTTITPGAVIALPDTNIGDTTSVVIQVKNAGNLTGTVSAISINGADFTITGAPATPVTLQPGGSFGFTITFAPTLAAQRQASLSIGTDSFSLTGKGLGPKLVFSYAAGGATVKLGPTDSVVFSPIIISQAGQVVFTVQNTGTIAATIFNIGIGEANSPFSVSALPPLPLSLLPGAQSSFVISYAPIATGFSSGTLRLDSTIVPVIGSGMPPPALPAYSIQGPSGKVDPASQPNISLKLSTPYPIAIAGTPTLTAFGSLPADPAVQFSTGGRTVAFSIPANGTQAVFAGQGQQIQLQTGTVETTITLTPSFATQAGGVNLTPSHPTTLSLTVPAAAPTLIAGQVASSTSNGFVLTLTGFSTTRSLNGLTAQFTAAPGFSVPTTAINVDLTQASTLWFNSTASVAFGGQFAVTIPFTLSGTVSSTQTLIQSVSAVSVSISNGTGTSNTLQTALP